MKSQTVDLLLDRLRLEGIKDERVLAAVAAVPREEFVSDGLVSAAYEDCALPIECGQTISQPYVVARMSEAILARGSPQRILEVGTGSGYQAAVLSHLFSEVYSIERIKHLYDTAIVRLKGYANLQLRYGDGFAGWVDNSPFDRIIVTAAADKAPQALLEQLCPEGGEMIIPVGGGDGQQLQLIHRDNDDFKTQYLDRVIFVPMLPGCE